MRKRMTPFWVYGALILYTVLPLLCVLASGAIATHFGCTLDESGAHPCMAFGRDIGKTLVGLFVTGWLMLVTLPTGSIALIVYSIVLIARKNAGR